MNSVIKVYVIKSVSPTFSWCFFFKVWFISRCWFNFAISFYLALKRICCRCGKDYFMNAKGKYKTRDECHYHWGKLRRHRGTLEMLFCLKATFERKTSECFYHNRTFFSQVSKLLKLFSHRFFLSTLFFFFFLSRFCFLSRTLTIDRTAG